MSTGNSYRDDLEPLYKEDRYKTLHRQGETNAGLWLDKYLKKQDRKGTNGQDSAKQVSNRSSLIEEVAEIPTPDVYKQFYPRWQQMLASYGVTHGQMRLAKANGRMIIGLGDESVLETSIALHHTCGVPYIPGSALKGLAASYARQRLGDLWKPRGMREQNKNEDGAYEIVFGDTASAGYIVFFDALLHIDPANPDKRVLYRDTITVHHPSYYQGDAAPSDWDSPTPIPFLSATGCYMIALAAPDLNNGPLWIKRVFKIVEYALAEMGIGAKTSSGYGRMTLESGDEDSEEEEEEIAVIPEQASVRLLKKIKEGSWSYDLFAAWEQLPPDDEERIEVARALVEKLEKSTGKKRSPKDETRYQRLLQSIAQHTEA